MENTVRLQTVREHEVKGQNIPDYFQNHLSWVLLMLNRLKEVTLFKVKFPLNTRGVSYIILLHCLFFHLLTTGYYCAIFPFCGGGKKRRQKNKGVLWLGYHRYPSRKKKGKAFYVDQSQSEVIHFLRLFHCFSPRFVESRTCALSVEGAQVFSFWELSVLQIYTSWKNLFLGLSESPETSGRMIPRKRRWMVSFFAKFSSK